jgi:molecular chaperone GrpE
MSKEHIQHGQHEEVPENAEAGVEGSFAGLEADEGAQNSPETADSAQTGDSEASEEALALDPEEKIAELEAQIAETRDQLLRKAADFENFRKRMNQEKQNAIDFANQSLLLDIIPIIDDLERAIQAAGSSSDFAGQPAGRALLDGITMIEKRLTGQLESKWGLKRFDSQGEPFDPNRHEALMMEKSAEVTDPVVQEDLIKGYMLKDRVIRAAKVKVVMPENPGPMAGTSAAEGPGEA